MKFSIYQESQTGARSYNQDRVGYVFSRDALFMIVADGMGGHAQGEVAAQITVDTIGKRFQRDARPALASPLSFLGDAINAAHHAILAHAEQHQLLETPRTTVVAAIIQKGTACWAHVGDSRAYLFRERQVLTQTVDHSHVQQLLTQGIITAAAAATHPERNKIYNCLGAHVPPKIELSQKYVLRAGDTLLLCSDGLWGPLAPSLLANAFTREPLAKVVPALINQAVKNAGREADNVTALAMTWADDDGSASQDGGVSTRTMPADAFNSQIDMTAAAEADLSDDDIEKAISEIRSALAKSNRPQS